MTCCAEEETLGILTFLCRYGGFPGCRPEKNSVSRASHGSKLPAHHKLPQTASDLVSRWAQDYSKQQNVS